MMATTVTDVERIYENDLICRFLIKSDGLCAISVGKVYIDRSGPEGIPYVQWYLEEKTRQTLDTVLEKATIFLLNREVFIGSVAIERVFQKGGFVNGTKQKLIGLVQQAGQDGRKYVLPGIEVGRLKKLAPLKVGSYLYWKGWVGKVKKLHQQPDSLSELAPNELEVCWLHYFAPSDSSVEIAKPGPCSILKDDKCLKVFHFSNDDCQYFGPDESFELSWTAEDEDNAVSYKQWQGHMLLSSTGLIRGDPPLKRVKADPIFEVGERVVVTAIALQTTADVVFPDELSIIHHTMKVADIPELGLEVLPRAVPSKLPIKFKNMDLVLDRKQSSVDRYGFIINPFEQDGQVLVKWIYDLGCSDTADKTELVKTSELVLSDFQSQLNPKSQMKIVTLRDGSLGTLRGIRSLDYKVVVRLVGTFVDKECWPHEMSFLKGEED